MGIANHELQFRQWLGEHTGLLVKVVRSFAEGPADQDDLFQEILLQVWLSLPNFRDDSKPTTWLYRVALEYGAGMETEREETMAQAGFAFDFRCCRTKRLIGGGGTKRSHRRSALCRDPRLQPAKRALVVLYLDGFTYREIAEVVGISESNVGVSLNRIKKELAATVKEDGDESFWIDCSKHGSRSAASRSMSIPINCSM